MKPVTKCVLAATGAILIGGCVVREEPRRRVYVESTPAPAPVVVEEGPPAGYVEVVPASPGPDFIYEPSGYFFVDGHRHWRRGYWHHR
jgi:hypothetical protein